MYFYKINSPCIDAIQTAVQIALPRSPWLVSFHLVSVSSTICWRHFISLTVSTLESISLSVTFSLHLSFPSKMSLLLVLLSAPLRSFLFLSAPFSFCSSLLLSPPFRSSFFPSQTPSACLLVFLSSGEYECINSSFSVLISMFSCHSVSFRVSACLPVSLLQLPRSLNTTLSFLLCICRSLQYPFSLFSHICFAPQ